MASNHLPRAKKENDPLAVSTSGDKIVADSYPVRCPQHSVCTAEVLARVVQCPTEIGEGWTYVVGRKKGSPESPWMGGELVLKEPGPTAEEKDASIHPC